MRAWAPRVWSFTEAWKASPNDPEKILFISNGYVKRSDAPHNSFGQAQTSSAQLPVPSLINRHLAMRHDCAIVEHIALLNSPDNLREQCLDTYIHTYSTVVPTDSAHHAPGSQWTGTRRQASFWHASTPGTVTPVHSESCKKSGPRAEPDSPLLPAVSLTRSLLGAFHIHAGCSVPVARIGHNSLPWTS